MNISCFKRNEIERKVPGRDAGGNSDRIASHIRESGSRLLHQSAALRVVENAGGEETQVVHATRNVHLSEQQPSRESSTTALHRATYNKPNFF